MPFNYQVLKANNAGNDKDAVWVVFEFLLDLCAWEAVDFCFIQCLTVVNCIAGKSHDSAILASSRL